MLAQYGVLMANSDPSLTDLQTMAVAWHRRRFPGTGVFEVVSKATEELGEVAQALNARGIGERTDRGDPAQEVAQLIVVLLVLAGRYMNTPVYPLVQAEIARLLADLNDDGVLYTDHDLSTEEIQAMKREWEEGRD